jgi:transcriptional regulator with XRE-family HTH domain
MAPKIGNYLYVRRRQWALTQEELAFLLGYCTKTAVSKLEGRVNRIPLRVSLACHIIFGIEPRELFPALMEQVEEGVVRRMYELYERLKKAKPSERRKLKMQLLHDALTRATDAAPRKI